MNIIKQVMNYKVMNCDLFFLRINGSVEVIALTSCNVDTDTFSSA